MLDNAESGLKQKSQAELRAMVEDRSRQEQLGIAQRQTQAEAEARAARESVAQLRPPPMQLREPSTGNDMDSDLENPPILPLESPRRYDGDSSTDAESADETKVYRRLARMHLRESQDMSPTKSAFGMYVYAYICLLCLIKPTAYSVFRLHRSQQPRLLLHRFKPSTTLNLCLNISVPKAMLPLYNRCSRNQLLMRHLLLFYSAMEVHLLSILT